MNHKDYEKRKIFERVKNQEISSDEAYQLMNEINNSTEVEAYVNELACYQCDWEQSEIDPAIINRNKLEDMIVFDNDCNEKDIFDVLDAVDERTIIRVKTGNVFTKINNQEYAINPKSANDYVLLFANLVEQGFNPKVILNLWTINGKFNGDIKIEDTDEYLNVGIYAIFHILTAMSELKIKSLLKFLVALEDTKITNPFADAIRGFAGSLSICMPNLIFSTFEMVFDDSSKEHFLKLSLDELSVDNGSISVDVKYEGNTRYIRKIKEAENNPNEDILLKQQGVYLITGGAGGLGLVFARYLAKAYKAKLVLTGRSKLNIIKENELNDIRKSGAEVLYIQADVGNVEEMQKVIWAIKEQFGQLNGILHTSGINSITGMLKKDFKEFKEILWPKVQGTIVLDAVSKEEELDFLLLFSSVSAVLGDFGQGDYAVSNRFLDGFVSYREGLRRKENRKGVTKAISWPLWRDGGMHLEREAESLYLQSSGMSYLENEDGIQVFENMLSNNETHMIVFKGDRKKIQRFIDVENQGKQSGSPKKHNGSKNKKVKSFAPKGLTLEQKVEYDIVKVASDILKIDIDKLDVYENIGSFGFDSISLKEFADKIGEIYQVEITPVVFFDLSTLRAFSHYFITEFTDEIHDFYVESEVEYSRSKDVRTIQRLPFISNNLSNKLVTTLEKESIAIVGMSGVFPGSNNVEEFWENMIQERDLIREIPVERWDWKTYYENSEDKHEKISKWGGFINGIDQFDAKFFNISPKEAECMDPQQRVFLETVWKTVEDAGYKATELSGKNIGVFVGVQANEYHELFAHTGTIQPQQVTGNANALISNRISFLLNLRGPSESIDTACSSSLVALNRAVKSIQCGESELALAGGVSLMISPNVFIGAIKLGVLSPDGRCKTFDRSANGYVRGEGGGCVLLKPLSKAIADNDNIYAVIRGAAEGHGGKANSLTAPNSDAQANLLIRAYEDAGINPDTITFIEAHGTGTELGDPVEIQGLKKAFNTMMEKQKSTSTNAKYCAIGSVKTNIGHLEPASGIAGLIKVVLSMKNKQLPAILHFTEQNPYIDLKETPFYILNQTKPWEKIVDDKGNEIPRRAGISSFGFGGACAHIVLEEYENSQEDSKLHSDTPHLIILSAKKQELLRDYAEQLRAFLVLEATRKTNEDGYKGHSLVDIAYTLQTGRESMNHRLVIKTNSVKHLIEGLKAYLDGKPQEHLFIGDIKESLVDTLLSGENGRSFIKSTIVDNDLDKLARLWVNGIEIDWKLLYINTAPRRVSLPSYPFAKERHWIDNAKDKPIDIVGSDLFVKKQLQIETETLYYSSHWEKCELTDVQANKSAIRLLLFDTNEDLFNLLRIDQKEKIQEVILVKQGEKYEELSEWEYIVNPLKKEDYNKLFEVLKEKNYVPTHILHLWSPASSLHDLNQLTSSAYFMIYLCCALLEAQWKNKCKNKCKIIYTYYTNRGEYQPQYEAVGGLLKTVCLENAKISFKTIKLELDSKKIEDVRSLLLKELEDESTEVRIQDEQRSVKRLVEIEDILKEEDNKKSLFKDKGVYLITGGAGGLGLIFAEYLAKRYKARLILSSRSEINSEKQAKIQALKQHGAEVIYIKADVSKRDEVERLIDEAKTQFNEINGIIHSAGVIRDAYLINKTEKDIEEVLLPKVFGTVWLDEATKDEKLDFFALFSSIAAVLGSPGQVDYAYGNGFMDSYIQKRAALVKTNERYGKSITINWPLWRHGGMKVDYQVEQMIEKTLGLQLLQSQIGIEAFEFSLIQPNNQLLVLHGNKKKIQGLLAKTSEQESKDMNKFSYTKIDENSLMKSVQDDCVFIVSEILKIKMSEIDLEEDLSTFGFDSISFTEFSNKLSDTYNLYVMPAIFYEHGTLNSLITYLCEEYKEILSAYYGDDWITEELKPRVQEVSHQVKDFNAFKNADEPIAIVGMSGIMPGADTLDEFWENIEAEKDLITEIPIERWNWKDIYGDPISEPNKTNIKWGGFIRDVDKFDPLFFGLSKEEAEFMDPQQRILLQTVWKTIEDAGYKSKDLSGTNTGVFVGVGVLDYGEVLNDEGIEIHPLISTGMSHSIVANRISYLLNLRGPSEPIDTACASSLTAIHRAVEEIQLGHCDMAIVGSIKIILSPTLYIAFSKAGMLSEDGRCKTFDKTANGYVRGEGSGAVLLKPLSKAIADCDNIYAVIKGSAINHGGHVNSMTTPNPNAQAEVIIKAWEKANVDPSTIGYIEAHGAGTNLGDSIEVNGLKKAFKQLYKDWGIHEPPEQHCGIGSVKTNIGHLETAAGMAGLLKVILAIKNKKIPATIHLSEMNPNIQLEGSPLYIVDKTREWIKEAGELRRAGISAFGYGGVNAHVVLEEYEQVERNLMQGKNPQIIILSAKNVERLKDYVREMISYLDDISSKEIDVSIRDLAYTLQIGRDEMTERLAIVVASIDTLKEKLELFMEASIDIDNLYINTDMNYSSKTRFLIDGEEGLEFVNMLIESKGLEKLAQLWVSGVEIDWQKLHRKHTVKRLSLPTYPFAKERYWITQKDSLT
jgi:polyketide synthase PksN